MPGVLLCSLVDIMTFFVSQTTDEREAFLDIFFLPSQTIELYLDPYKVPSSRPYFIFKHKTKHVKKLNANSHIENIYCTFKKSSFPQGS